jgi:hypothetical protein
MSNAKSMKSTVFVGLIMLVLCVDHALGQTFQKTFGGSNVEFIWCIQPTTDSGCIMAGSTSSFWGVSGANCYLIKIDKYGDTAWTRVLTSGSAYYACEAPDGGYIAVGWAYNAATTGTHAWAVKTDSNGNVVWAKTYAGTITEEIVAARPAKGGGYYLLGATSSSGAGSFDVLLLKVDELGDTLWTRTYGGPMADEGHSIVETADSGVVIAGATSSFGMGQDDVMQMKVDKDGNMLWAKAYGGADAEVGSAVVQAFDGGFLICGKTHSFGTFVNDGDVYAIRTDANGDTLWSRVYGGNGTDWARSAIQVADSSFLLVGDTWSFGKKNEVYLVSTDKNGMLLWSKTYGDSLYDNGIGVCPAKDGGYFVGASSSSFGAGLSDYYLLKTDAFGNSGCNDAVVTTQQAYAATQVTDLPFSSLPAGLQVLDVSPVVRRGAIVNTMCYKADTTADTVLAGVYISTVAAIRVLPNPVAESATVYFSQPVSDGRITVHDYTGRLLISGSLKGSATSYTLNTGSLGPGQYLLTVTVSSLCPEPDFFLYRSILTKQQ